MKCEEKERLAKEYQTATAEFAEAVRQLHLMMGTSSKAEYERLQHASNEARIQSEHSRLAFEQHVAAHRC